MSLSAISGAGVPVLALAPAVQKQPNLQFCSCIVLIRDVGI
jgi:hypothetical protein